MMHNGRMAVYVPLTKNRVTAFGHFTDAAPWAWPLRLPVCASTESK
jgi:hypothetical protein